jgi:hypothetical protein
MIYANCANIGQMNRVGGNSLSSGLQYLAVGGFQKKKKFFWHLDDE